MNTNVVGRFAPSPSGYLHMGNLLAMLLAWLDCRSLGGKLVFRMEDLDPARSKPVYRDALADDLRWLGLDWDEGWPEPDYAQSRRTALYEAAFEELKRHCGRAGCFSYVANRSGTNLTASGKKSAKICISTNGRATFSVPNT